MISIIIPVYNEVANIKALLPRIDQLSKGHETEVILSTGVCTEDYSKFTDANDYLNTRITLVCGNRKGRAKQMNDGADKASGEVLVFLHADVIPPESFFDEIQDTIGNGQDAGFFSYRFDSKRLLLRINGYLTRRDGLFTGGGDQCLFIAREVFYKLGGFNESQVIMEDFEFFRRMKKNKVPYTIVHNDLIVSSRKYQRNSYLRVNLTNLLLVILFRLGYPAKRLKALHNRCLHLPYQNPG